MQTNDQRESRSLLKVVQVSIIISLLWKIQFYWHSLNVIEQFPLVDTFFPELFRSQTVLVTAYCVAVASPLISLAIRWRRALVFLGIAGFASLAILCVHQNSYNDVTFLCCAWASLWCLWFATRLDEDFDTLYPRAAWLSQVILSLVFFGAAIGKLTPGYWSGEVLHEIYFTGRNFWTYNLMRESMSAEGLREAATWHSRMVIASEFVCAFLWLMPRKVASAVAITVLCGIALTNNLLLFSVVACLVGLSLVGLHDKK